MQNFRLLTAHVTFHKIWTLIGSFCRNEVIKFQLKNYRGVISHCTGDWCKIWRKTDLFQKWQEFHEFWPEYMKVSKICSLIGLFCAKYLMFHLKNDRGVILHDTEEKMENVMANFHQSTWNCENWNFDGILLSKVENAWAKNIQKNCV